MDNEFLRDHFTRGESFCIKDNLFTVGANFLLHDDDDEAFSASKEGRDWFESIPGRCYHDVKKLSDFQLLGPGEEESDCFRAGGDP